MKLCCFRIFALLIFAFSSFSYAQSLGEFARQARAERERNPIARSRVITNDDITSDEPTAGLTKDGLDGTSKDAVRNDGKEPAPAEGSDVAEAGADKLKDGKDVSKAGRASAKERETEEAEIQKRTNEINRQYVDRVAALREKINTAQLDLAKFQRDQMESTNEFRRTLGVSPNPGTYDQQQRFFIEQITTQRGLINSLNSQLEDALESARHAGVPHVYD
jgi:hypothetical protein